MKLEQLTFAVHPSVLKDWIEFEDKEWLPWLRQQPGFINKRIDVHNGLCTNSIWWKDSASLGRAREKQREITALNLKMRRLFGSKVIMVRSHSEG